MSKDAAYLKLLSKRTNCFNAINLHKTKADAILANTTQNEILTRLSLLESSYNRFIDIRDALLESDDYAETDMEVSDDDITEMYVTALTIFKNACKENSEPSLDSTRNSQASIIGHQNNEVRLGKIVIRKFNGDYEHWTTFYDTFNSCVHHNTAYSDIAKMYYLRDSLTGTALSVISRLPISEANYATAWKLLQDRFHNKRAIVTECMANFLSTPQMVEPCAKQLREMADTVRESLQTIETLDIHIENWDPMIVHIIESKLDTSTKFEWERSLQGSTEIPTYDQMTKFLETQYRILFTAEKRENSKQIEAQRFNESKKYFKYTQNQSVPPNSLRTNAVDTTERCCVCNEKHTLFICPTFDSWSVRERINFIRDSKRCENCLKYHNDECKSKFRCKTCRGFHNTKLHLDKPLTVNTCVDNEFMRTEPSTSHIHAINLASSSKVLATALVTVKDKFGASHILRAFIDQRAESAFITERATQLLRLSPQNENVPLIGVDNVSLGYAKKSVTIEVTSMHDKSFTIKLKAFLSKTIITTRTSCDESLLSCDYLKNIPLADPNFLSTHKIDLLLGVDVYALCLANGIRRGNCNQPVAQNSRLGWIVFGALNPMQNGLNSVRVNYMSISQALQRFWQNEEVNVAPIRSKEHTMCKQFFEETSQRQANGRFQVSLPYNMDMNDENFLGNTHKMALMRQLNLEKRFKTNPKLKQMYNAFMQEYLDLGHMTILKNDTRNGCYLPHHAVIRESSTTTKLRSVFDASAKSTNGYSLNDRLLNGPTIQPELFDIFTRWRINKVAIIADIEKMYRQIDVNESDRMNQKILYRFSENEPMQTYILNTITYGTKPAPYLAIETTFVLADQEAENYPNAAKRVKTDMYVDDLLSGSDSTEEAISLRREFTNLFNSGHFPLRKWASNDESVLQDIPPEFRAMQTPFELHKNDEIKTLGVFWNPRTDKLQFKIDLSTLSSAVRITKRQLLSDGSKLYDPCGILAPVTIKAKILMQDVWKTGIDWDSFVNETIQNEWNNYRREMPLLEKVTVDRWLSTTKSSNISLHGFSDSSSKAYCAVIYLVQQTDNTVTSKIVCSKTKVAPLLCDSIPRLELCGAVLLTELMKRVANNLKVPKDNIHLWTDSELVLNWLCAHPSNWATFVANRVSLIQKEYNISYWRYVSTHENPADIGSRGVCASKLVDNDLWFHGPNWILLNQNEWPNLQWPTPKNKNKEERKQIATIHSKPIESEILTRFSRLSRLLRVTAFILRFINNIRHKTKHAPIKSVILSPNEIRRAKMIWIRHVQAVWFSQEIIDLKTNGAVSSKSLLKSLNPRLNENGLLNLHGRLEYSNLPIEQKFPLILPQQSHLAKLIIDRAHTVTMHGTIHLTLAYVRQEFWIINCRNLVKSHVHKCITCYRLKPQPLNQLMAPLPKIKTTPDSPFNHCGIDFAGPFEIKTSHRKNAAITKGYVCVFVCMVTKAIHLEACSSLHTATFIAAVRRMVSTRGLCSNIYCDNGTNFQGASNELPLLLLQAQSDVSKEIANTFANDGIKFHFIPPSAASWGGQWESYVKLTKHHLNRITLSIKLTSEEMSTLLKQIEACINSRPLCAITSDTDELDFLTPGHFLIGRPMNAIPEPNLLNLKENTLDRWQKVQRAVQHFWSRWQTEYLHTLHPRKKWFKEEKDLAVNDAVMIIDDNYPPCKWRIARVVQVHTGPDGLVRMATVEYPDTETWPKMNNVNQKPKGKFIQLQRPIVKLCKLPSVDSQMPAEADGGEHVAHRVIPSE